MTRISRDNLFMEIAKMFALRGTCVRAQVGAIIVRDHHIVSHGYNGAPPGMAQCDEVGCGGGEWETTVLSPHSRAEQKFPNGCTRAVHAEANAIAYAARQGVPVEGSRMYTTHQPCLPCAQLIVSSQIAEVVYLEPYRLMDGLNLLTGSSVTVVKYV